MPPSVPELLGAAVAAVSGVRREGQERMARAVATALDGGEHLLVEAGTGTGKSLAYLVPALVQQQRVVIATATLALQAQLVDRDLPRVTEALEPLLGRRPTFAIAKGRRNYLCLLRLNDGPPDDDSDALFAASSTSVLGREVARLRAWASTSSTGDRDEIVPGTSDQAWSQVSVTAGECLGAARCPYGVQCWAERARATAAKADVVVTNHALLAIDAKEHRSLLPDHCAVVVDEAHELVDRVTNVATAELSPALVERAARRARGQAGADLADRLSEAGASLALDLDNVPDGRLDCLPQALAVAVTVVRDTARDVVAACKGAAEDPAQEIGRRRALDALTAILTPAERLVAGSEHDVAWLTRDERRTAALRVAPLSVAAMLRENLFGDRTVILTSATLRLGGRFDSLARSVGLPVPSVDELPWRGLDVGSPFDYRRQGILYIARQLPRPGRDGLPPEYLDELAELITAAGGRTLGLFSSMRAATAATEALRPRLSVPILRQGEDSTAELVRRFAADPATCLFGTLSLWQGVDVPGSSLQLVVIDRIPFPRPDDPLASARARAVEKAGGNGFLTVSVSHAALRLAQGAGRLIRTASDRGVVAVLDPRLATAGYAGFLRESLPAFWITVDAGLVRTSLAAIDASAPEPLLVLARDGRVMVAQDRAGEVNKTPGRRRS